MKAPPRQQAAATNSVKITTGPVPGPGLPSDWQPRLPMLRLEKGECGREQLADKTHVLVVLPGSMLEGGSLPGSLPEAALLEKLLHRQKKTVKALLRTPAGSGQMPEEPLIPEGVLPGGGLIRWVALDPESTTFLRQQQLRQALDALLEEQPAQLDVLFHGSAGFVASVLGDVAYVAAVNRVALPRTLGKKKEDTKAAVPVARRTKTVAPEIRFWAGSRDAQFLAELVDQALVRTQANTLARALCVLPPNQLTPKAFRELLPGQLTGTGIRTRLYDLAALRKLKAGAFLAVAQGSRDEDAAIVHLSYVPKRRSESAASSALPTVALVGKGICFDTGGHNLKPARYMAGMHEDMAGAAIALAVIQAAARLALPVRVDAWLALARNDISPTAYCQGDVVTALNGQTIEIVHTDAEGRMVLADTLTLAAANKPDVVIDFATLTGSMTTALGQRMSGCFASTPELAEKLLQASERTGERLVVFPMPDDYDSALASTVADIRQCTLEGEADHILAARFLHYFVGDTPWVHLDLSAATCKGGLGAVGTDTTGFGVGLTLDFLRSLAH